MLWLGAGAAVGGVWRVMRTSKFGLISILIGALAASASAAPIWTESTDGDLSNDRLAPTSLGVLGNGSNTVTGTTVANERDYFTIVIPSGSVLSQIVLTQYDHPTELAFLAVQSGTTITVDPLAPSAATLLGWVHPSASLLGTDILDDMGAGFGAIGFLPPLGPGTYSFWLQQTGGTVIGYGLDFVVVPEPTAAMSLALGLTGIGVARRRR